MENCSVALNHTAIKPFIADSRDTDFTNLKSSLKLGTPNGTLLHWTHTAPKNQRITEWRVQMRLPELSYNYQKFMEIGDFIISSGGNGKTLFVTIKTNTTAYEAFSVDSSDARLHLIAVKEVGTNAGMAVYNIYVDNHPPRSVRVPQFNKSVPITIFSSSTVDSNAFMGCINGIWFGHKDETNNNAPFIDFFKLASENEELREDFSLLHNVDYTGCGIYDEDKWTSESSSFGRLTSFDQYAKTSGSGILFYILVVASIVLSFVLIVIFVVSLILTKKRRNESKETQTFN
ncbi:hypothetical protein M3Y94_00733000 [Aphelenchoides besseyi]|nr:hypothetical protein M3Y94_00733000 [Aphelenchoides besseyi]